MKRNETPLNASILDALCSPIILTGNYSLLTQSHPWLRKNYSGKTGAPTVVYNFLPTHSGLPGYIMIENNRASRICAHVNPIIKSTTYIKTDIKTTDKFKPMANATKRVNQ